MTDRFGGVRALLAEGVASGVFPGAVLEVRREGARLLEAVVGDTRLVGGTPMTRDTFFDLASVSKVVSTTSVTMRFVDAGRLTLDAPVRELLPEIVPADKAAVTVRHLLTHTSGLPAWKGLFEPLLPLAREGRFEEARAALVRSAAEPALEAAPGTRCVYSDLGFLLLGALLERLGGARLDVLFEREVAGPLGLEDLFYVDVGREQERRAGVFAATERCVWRGEVVLGVVHDENTWVSGGVAGHAGLFGRARAVGAFADALLAVAAGGPGWIGRETLAAFWRRDPYGIGASYAHGWDTPSPSGSQAGTRLPGAFGHTGFTGTSLWIDPGRALAVVLLTNRVHPTRDNARIKEFRPRLHDAVVEAL